MYMLQLFDSEMANSPIDARLLREGVICLGRDTSADWTITDPDCALSRRHCELRAEPKGLFVRSLGRNGVVDEAHQGQLPDDELIALQVPGTLRMGRFRLLATYASQVGAIEEGQTMILSPPLGSSVEVPSQWVDRTVSISPRDGSQFEAFCEGAQLDSSLLSSEEPEEIMRRAGALYRQMVLGIGDLMAERNSARARYELTRTTIGGEGNNPFKWAPSQRLAIDLLLAGSSSFLYGPDALKASFQDVKRHLIATFAGLRGSLRYAIEHFSPASIEAASAERATLLKSRAALHAEEAKLRHADLAAQLDENMSGSLDRAFVEAYDQAEEQLDRGGLA